LLAVLGLVYVIYFPIRVARLIWNGDLSKPEFKKKYGGIYEVYKEDSLKTAGFEVVVLIKKALIAFSLVFLGGSPTVQLISIILYSIVYCVLIIKWKPYKQEKANSLFYKTELMFIIGLILLIYIVIKEADLSVTVNKTLGWICVYLFSIQLVFMVAIYFRTLERSAKVKPQTSKKVKV
jgi:hypothetical protein